MVVVNFCLRENYLIVTYFTPTKLRVDHCLFLLYGYPILVLISITQAPFSTFFSIVLIV